MRLSRALVNHYPEPRLHPRAGLCVRHPPLGGLHRRQPLRGYPPSAAGPPGAFPTHFHTAPHFLCIGPHFLPIPPASSFRELHRISAHEHRCVPLLFPPRTAAAYCPLPSSPFPPHFSSLSHTRSLWTAAAPSSPPTRLSPSGSWPSGAGARTRTRGMNSVGGRGGLLGAGAKTRPQDERRKGSSAWERVDQAGEEGRGRGKCCPRSVFRAPAGRPSGAHPTLNPEPMCPLCLHLPGRPSFVEVLASLQHIRTVVAAAGPAPSVRLPTSPLPSVPEEDEYTSPNAARALPTVIPTAAPTAGACPVSRSAGGSGGGGSRDEATPRLMVTMPHKLKQKINGGVWVGPCHSRSLDLWEEAEAEGPLA